MGLATETAEEGVGCPTGWLESTRALAELGRDIISDLEVMLRPRECLRLRTPPTEGASLSAWGRDPVVGPSGTSPAREKIIKEWTVI